jgi:hypothetical protein
MRELIPAAEALSAVRVLIADLTDPDPCQFDHHGHCQAHGWTDLDRRCPHARAKELLKEQS